jgi:hypothetical protein
MGFYRGSRCPAGHLEQHGLFSSAIYLQVLKLHWRTRFFINDFLQAIQAVAIAVVKHRQLLWQIAAPAIGGIANKRRLALRTDFDLLFYLRGYIIHN